MIAFDIIVLVFILIILSILSLVVVVNYKKSKPINKSNFLRFIIVVIFQFLIIIFLCWLFLSFICILTFPADAPSLSSCPKEKMSCTMGYRKNLSVINQAIVMDKQLEGHDAGNCTNDKELAELFLRRLNVKESYISPNKRTLKMLAKDKLADKPYMILVDDVLYIIEKAKGKCGSTNSSNPDEANCVVIVDVNGTKPPNELSTGDQEDNYKFKDRYRVIILKDKAVPAASSENNIAASIVNERRR